MDDFVRRPRRPHIDLSAPQRPAAARRPIVVKDSTESAVRPVPNKLPVRPQLATSTHKTDEKPLVDLSVPPKNKDPLLELDEDETGAINPGGNPDETTGSSDGPGSPPKTKRRFRFRPRKPRNKKEWAILIIALVVLLGGTAGAVYWFVLRPDPKPPVVVKPPEKKAEIPKPTTEASKLSGLQVPFGVNERPVTSVMIENSPEARPQAGLKDASIIFEAIAEGGITRFNALYQDTQPDYIGPVRSIRPYYIDWFLPFDAAVAHAGGSPQGLADVRSLGVKDLDQFANGGAYQRVADRYAPHNLYTSIAKLNALQASKGWTTSTFTGFERKKEAKLATPTARTIDLSISSFYYNVRYDYDPATNSYLRSQGGEQHRDDRSGTQLAPKVVVAIVMQRGLASDRQHTEYKTVGSGNMVVFQDGGRTEGTWTKDSRSAQWKFTDAEGKTIAFNPGQTWISIVDANGDIVSNP